MILLNKDTKCLVQGITGKQGSFHTEQMLNYNTNIAADLANADRLVVSESDNKVVMAKVGRKSFFETAFKKLM